MGNKLSPTVDSITDSIADLEISDEFNLERLMNDNSVWGLHQHDWTKHTDLFRPGFVMDLETFWANGHTTWKNAYIQQIGSCPVGHPGENFDMITDVPKQSQRGKPRKEWHSLEDLKTWCQEEDQDFAKSVGCYKKIMKVKTPDDVFDNIHHSRKFFEELGPVTDFSVTNMRKIKKLYKHFNYPLVFPFEYALQFFIEYFKEQPVWYAHNGNKFDYPIMEKWFRLGEYRYRCVPQPNAPGKKTTAMKNMREGPQVPMVSWKAHDIGFYPWKVLETDSVIKCYDTMWMFKQHPRSKYVKQGRGAKRVSQGHEIGYTENSKGKQQILWSDGSKTANKYSFKLQDILQDIGIRANDPTAHTALADCITLREAMYRVMSNKTVEERERCAFEAISTVRSNNIKKIVRRLRL